MNPFAVTFSNSHDFPTFILTEMRDAAECLAIQQIAKTLLSLHKEGGTAFSTLPPEICCKIISYCSNWLSVDEAHSIALKFFSE